MDGRRNRLLQVVSDAAGWRPIDVLADGKPVLAIDRPSANSGPRSGECNLFEGHLLVRLTSPDDGTTVRCEVYLKGRKLDPAQAEVSLAQPETQWGSCWGRVTISLLALVFSLGLASSLDRSFGRGGNPHQLSSWSGRAYGRSSGRCNGRELPSIVGSGNAVCRECGPHSSISSSAWRCLAASRLSRSGL